jgi:hypothetical protein
MSPFDENQAPTEFGDFAEGELDKLLAEGERSIEEEGTIDAEEAFRQRQIRRMQRREGRET